jgi:hypothetical protein
MLFIFVLFPNANSVTVLCSGPKITMLNPEVADEETIQTTNALMNSMWENSRFYLSSKDCH